MATYNIKAPDGYTYSVEGPEGADQNDLFAFVQQQMEQRALHRELINQTGLMTTMGRGIARGAGELMSTATDVIPAMAGSALGFTDYAKEQMGEYAQKKEAREAKYPTLFPSYKDVQGIGDFPKFALETISEQAANLATSLIPAVGIGSLAGRSALTTVGKSLAAQAAERGLAKEAAEEFIATGMKAAAQSPEVIQAVSRATARGQALGSYLGSYAQNAPEIFGNIYEHNNNQLAPGAALIFGSAAAALDAILPMKLAMRMNPVMKVGIVEKVLEKSGMQKGLIRSIASNTLADLGIEGLTESAQEAISIAAERFVSEHPKVFGSKEWDRIIESGIRGAVAGGGFGAVGGTREGFKARAERIQEQKEAQQAAQLRQQVSESDAQILAEQQQWEQARAAQPQMEFPGMEQPGPYTSVAPKFTPDVGEDVNEAQRVMFTETGELTPQMEKLAGRFQKAREKEAAAAKKQAEQEAAAAQKQADAQAKAETALRKRFLSAKQMEFPGFDLGTVEGTRAREQEQARAAQESGQGDLFAAPTPAPTATPAPVETPAPTGPIPVSSANATLDNFTVIDDPQAFRKLLGPKEFGPTAKIFSPTGALAGKDLSKPEDVATIRSVLTAYAEKRPNTATIIENFLNKRPEFTLIKPTPEGAEDAARANVGAGGAGIRPLVGEGNTEQLVEGAKAPVTGGVVPSETPIEQPAGGETPSSVAVKQPPTPTEPPAAPTETTVTPTEPPAAPTETTVTPTEAPTTAAPVIPKFIRTIDDNVDNLLGTYLRDAVKAQGFTNKQASELVALIGDPRINELHSLLRLPRLATEYINIQLKKPTDARLEAIRSSVEQSSPELVPVFDNLVNAPSAQQEQMFEQLNHFAVQQLNDEIRTNSEKLLSAVKEPTTPWSMWLTKEQQEQIDALADSFSAKYTKENGDKLFLPSYVGPTFNDEQRALAERGDLSNLLRNLLDTTITDPAIKQVIRRIISLNLKTRIEIGDPTGGMALNSPAFQNWFGNSKVVDANGNPLVVYHGTTQNFSAFNAGRLGENTKHPTSQLGFFFSASPEVANLFTQTVDTGAWPVKVTQKAGANTMPVYLSIKNPYVMTVNDFKGVTGQQLKAFKERLIANGYDGIQIKGEPRFAEQFGGGEYAADTWVAFRPNDVKSAIGNRGTYDQNNPDIRYAEGKAGSYDPATNTITLDPTRGLNAHTFIHESLHAAISHVLANPNHPLTKEFTKFFTSIQDRLGSAYGATNLQEFAAELVGNPSFQAVLKSIKTPRSESLFRTIIRKIAEFFGFKPGTTAFETGVKFINDALDITGDVQPTGAQKLFLGTGDFTYPSEVSKLVPPLAGQAIERAKNALSNLTGRDIQKTLFGFFGLNHLNTIYGRDIPSFQMLLDAVEQRQGTQEQTEKEIAKKVREFTAVNNQYPDQVAKMGLFASKARRAEVDVLSPFKPTQVAPEKWAKMKAADKAKFVEAEGKRTQAYLAFKNEFSQFAKPVQDMYRTMRNDFDAQFKQFITEFEKAAEAGGLSKKFINDYITKYPLVGYIPFKRYGDFWVEYTDPESNERVASSFESIRERQMFIDQMLKGVEYRAYQRIQDATYTGQGVPQGSFVYKIMSALRESGASAEHLNSVYQAYLEAFPASSLMKQFMESKNVRGEDTDIIRNYNNLMTQYARKLSQLKYTPQIDRALSQIAQEGNASRNETVTAVAQHVIDGASFIHNPTYSNAVRTMASASYFMNMAGNISTGVLNLVSIMSTFNSMLNSRYVRGVAHSGFGVMESTAAVNSALKTVMKGGFKRDAKATLNGEYFDAWGNDPRYKALYREMMNHGQLEHTMARDVLEGRNQKTTPYSGRYARFMQALAVPLNASEKYVRSVTAVAAYDLEYERTKSQEKAIQYALEVVKEVNTGGMAAVSPRMFQSGFGRIFFTFKNFIWNQAAVIARAWHQAFANADPAMRAGARRYLLWTYGTAGAFLGLKGLPFYGAASVLATMINALVGDDDEPFDFDNFVRSNTSELFFKGLGNWAFNLEMANRAGIASDLIFRDDPRGVATNGYVQTAMMQAFGPVGGAILNTGRAVKMFNDGEIERAIETASPAFIRNMMKGVRYMTEGATTLKGEPIMEDISAYNSIMQMFGFSPADLSTRYELLQEGKGFEREINDRRKNIVRLYLMGVTTGDSDLVNEALEKGTKFSAAHPEKAITGDTYSRAVKQWEVAKQESIYGVRFDKKLLPQIREKFFSEE